MESSNPQKNQKPGSEEEEEEEDYLPAIRPHRYIYKYHRVGTKSLEKVAGPAATPAPDQQQPVVHETSSSTTHSSVITSKSEHVTRQTVMTESKFESVASGEITSAEILQPAVESSAAPLETTQSIAVANGEITSAEIPQPSVESSAAPLETTQPIAAANGEITSAEIPQPSVECSAAPFEATQSGEALVTTDSTIHTERNAEEPHAIDVSEHVENKEVFLQETPNQAALGTTETQETSAVPQSLEIQEIISTVTEEGNKVLSGLTTGTPEGLETVQSSAQKVISGLTSENHEIISGLSTQSEKQQQRVDQSGAVPHTVELMTAATATSDAMIHEVISGLTAADQCVVAGIVLDNGTEIIQGGSIDTLHETAHETQPPADQLSMVTSADSSAANIIDNIPSSEVVSGITTENVKIIGGLSTVEAEQHGLQTSDARTDDASAIASVKEVISGLTDDKIGVVSGLSAVPSEHQVDVNRNAATSPNEIVSGVTIDGISIVSGLTSDVDSELATSTSAVTLESSKVEPLIQMGADTTSEIAHEKEMMTIVGGITEDGTEIVSGLSAKQTELSTQLESHVPKDTHERVLTVIVGGLTSDGIGIISGLAYDVEAHAAEGNAGNVESVSGVSEKEVQIVSGVATDGEKIIAGITNDIPPESTGQQHYAEVTTDCSCSFEKQSEAVHTNDVQQDESVEGSQQSHLASDSGQQSIQPFSLPPEDVPARSDSF